MKQKVEELGLTDQLHKKQSDVVSPHIVESLGEEINRNLQLLNEKKRVLWGNLGFSNDLFEGIANQENGMISPEQLGNAYSNKDVGRRPDLESLLDPKQLEGIKRQRNELYEQRQKKEEEALNMMISQRSNKAKEFLNNPDVEKVRNQSSIDIKNSALITKDGAVIGGQLQGVGLTTSQGSNYQASKQATPHQSQAIPKAAPVPVVQQEASPGFKGSSGLQAAEKEGQKAGTVPTKPAGNTKVTDTKPISSSWDSLGAPAAGSGPKPAAAVGRGGSGIAYGEIAEQADQSFDVDDPPPKPAYYSGAQSNYTPQYQANNAAGRTGTQGYGAKSTPPVQQTQKKEVDFFDKEFDDLEF